MVTYIRFTQFTFFQQSSFFPKFVILLEINVHSNVFLTSHRGNCRTKKIKNKKKWEVPIFFVFVYRKTPLISTYVFSGLATVQVLIFGGRTYFRGYDKAG